MTVSQLQGVLRIMPNLGRKPMGLGELHQVASDNNISIIRAGIHAKGLAHYQARTILLGKGMSEGESRFVLAHEIGHFILGHDVLATQQDAYSLQDERSRELQAHDFAFLATVGAAQYYRKGEYCPDLHRKRLEKDLASSGFPNQIKNLCRERSLSAVERCMTHCTNNLACLSPGGCDLIRGVFPD